MNNDNPGTKDQDTRREFINAFLGTATALVSGSVVYPVIKFLNPPAVSEAVQSSVIVGNVDDFPVNSGKLFKFGRKPGLLVRLVNGEFRAFAATCTHLDCTVQFSAEQHDIWCACHNGHYDLNGNNIAGPPPHPLEQYTVNIREGEVIVLKENPST